MKQILGAKDRPADHFRRLRPCYPHAQTQAAFLSKTSSVVAKNKLADYINDMRFFESTFHPLVRQWFTDKYGQPTDIQARAWQKIEAGKHLLMTSPTGSGKTLAAFLWSLNALLTGRWESGVIRALYISPLRALNNDIQRNLTTPLDELERHFERAGLQAVKIRVMARSGDTPPDERRRMLRRPPEILITTPESLHIMLTSRSGRNLFGDLKTVILDEIHAVADNKRGVLLASAVERLTLYSGEFQRLALSATARPLEQLARWVGGFCRQNHQYTPRRVEVVVSSAAKEYALRVGGLNQGDQNSQDSPLFWQRLAETLAKRLRSNRSTLIFVNNRRFTERLALVINQVTGAATAWAHHGSLSLEMRKLVEERMKKGELKAIVATSSLELGIDIGSIDEVILLQPAPEITAAKQRIGRAGHSVGSASRGVFIPLFDSDYIEAAVQLKAILDGEIEALTIPANPLDMLTQIVLSMTVHACWKTADLYDFIRQIACYATLPARAFNLVLDMLAGHYHKSRLRELAPRLVIDRIAQTIEAKKGVERLIYSSGGAIPDRGYYDLRVDGDMNKIGELDEEFVWERKIGERIRFGAQNWLIVAIDQQKVVVRPYQGSEPIVPFWKGDSGGRSFFFAERIGFFLREWEDRSAEVKNFTQTCHCSPKAARKTLAIIEEQKQSAGLPHRYRLVIENYNDQTNKRDSKQVILHTLWGGKVNAPYSLALSSAWQEKFGYPLSSFYDDNCIALHLPHELTARQLVDLIKPDDLEILLRKQLESSLIFGARFRQNAGRALLLTKKFGRRVPLWLNRLKMKKLLSAVSRYADFPILTETWRSCLSEDFDLINLKVLLEDLRRGRIEIVSSRTTKPSPLAGGVVFKSTNYYMYELDQAFPDHKSRQDQALVRELLGNPDRRPPIDPVLSADLQKRLQRALPGYAPTDKTDLFGWVQERLFIPETEWRDLLAAIERDSRKKGKLPAFLQEAADLSGYFAEKIAPFNLAGLNGVIARQNQKDLLKKPSDPEIVSRWLSYYAVIDLDFFVAFWPGVDPEQIPQALVGQFTVGAQNRQICDQENLERLLRLRRLAERPQPQALDLKELPLFTALFQGLINSKNPGLADLLEQWVGYPFNPEILEKAIIPARLPTYQSQDLDFLSLKNEFFWYGDNKTASFCFYGEQDIYLEKEPQGDPDVGFFPEPLGRYDFFTLKQRSNLPPKEVYRQLWRGFFEGRFSPDRFSVISAAAGSQFKFRKTAGKTQPRLTVKRRYYSSGQNRPSIREAGQGLWFLTPRGDMATDALEKHQKLRERVRQLFRRYGVLFREQLKYESKGSQWSKIFPALRLMELAGECYGGQFFRSVAGAQFISRQALALLTDPAREKASGRIWWVNAQDPASYCGIDLPSLKAALPVRRPGNYAVYRDSQVVMHCLGNGKELRFFAQPDDPRLPQYLRFFHDLTRREVEPRDVNVFKVNGIKVGKSPYQKALLAFGFQAHLHKLVFRRPIK